MAKMESCFHCVYSHWDRNQAMWTMSVGVAVRPTCGNQPDFPGRMRECPLGRICRNFRARPPVPTGETVKTIPLGDGFYAYVDAADYEWLNQWTWHLYNGYAVRRENNRVISMHRQIMQAPKGMEVDHKNRNKVDNTRENLHICTHAQNARNRRKPRSTSSRFWGVSHMKSRGKYRAFVCHKGEVVSRGCFTDEIEAAQAHDRGVIELSGESAQLNFPEEWPAQRGAQVHARFQAGLKRQGKKAAREQAKASSRPRPRRRDHKPRAASAKPRAAGDKGRTRAGVRGQKGKRNK